MRVGRQARGSATLPAASVGRYRRTPYPCGSSRHQLRRSPQRLHLSAREIVSSGVCMSRLMLVGERTHVDHR